MTHCLIKPLETLKMPATKYPSDPKTCQHEGKVWTNKVELVNEGWRKILHQHTQCVSCGFIRRCSDQEVILKRK